MIRINFSASGSEELGGSLSAERRIPFWINPLSKSRSCRQKPLFGRATLRTRRNLRKAASQVRPEPGCCRSIKYATQTATDTASTARSAARPRRRPNPATPPGRA